MDSPNKPIKEIRELVKKGKISKALDKTEAIAPDKFINDLQLLTFQFADWKRKNSLDLGVLESVRNRIIYALLEILSLIEKDLSTGKEKYISQHRAKLEEAIKEKYSLIEGISKKNEPDVFLNLVLNENPEVIENILKAISQQKEKQSVFEEIDELALLLKKKNSPEENYTTTLSGIKNEYSKDNLFFEKWLNGELSKEKEINKLKWEITQYKKKHKKLLSGGIISSIMVAMYHYLGIEINIEIKDDYDYSELEDEVSEVEATDIE